MNKKRTRLEIIKDILEVLKNNKKARITHLIYKSNLSNNSIKPYIDELIKNKLVEVDFNEEKRVFRITARGMGFLEEFNKIKIFTESYGLL